MSQNWSKSRLPCFVGRKGCIWLYRIFGEIPLTQYIAAMYFPAC